MNPLEMVAVGTGHRNSPARIGSDCLSLSGARVSCRPGYPEIGVANLASPTF